MKLKAIVSCRVPGVGDFKAGDVITVADEIGKSLLRERPVRFRAVTEKPKTTTKGGKK